MRVVPDKRKGVKNQKPWPPGLRVAARNGPGVTSHSSPGSWLDNQQGVDDRRQQPREARDRLRRDRPQAWGRTHRHVLGGGGRHSPVEFLKTITWRTRAHHAFSRWRQ